MSETVTVGSIHIHDVSKSNIECKVHEHSTFASITIGFGGVTGISMICPLDEVAAIRRILGGW